MHIWKYLENLGLVAFMLEKLFLAGVCKLKMPLICLSILQPISSLPYVSGIWKCSLLVCLCFLSGFCIFSYCPFPCWHCIPFCRLILPYLQERNYNLFLPLDFSMIFGKGKTHIYFHWGDKSWYHKKL